MGKAVEEIKPGGGRVERGTGCCWLPSLWGGAAGEDRSRGR